jgi:predicted Rossmann fold flavoprotein
VKIDLKPALSEKQLDERIQRDFAKNLNKNLDNSLDELLPKNLIVPIINLAEIDGKKKVNSITKEERQKLGYAIKNIILTVSDFAPIEQAIITSGGVEVNEIDPGTMESKLVKNLYFAGEIIDVDAYTGGFNLQIAFSTGYAAGMSV